MSETLPAFRGLDLDFEKNIGDWKKIAESVKPQSLK